MTPADFIKRFGPRCFYHFTDTRNLPSIRQHGLLPLSQIQLLGVEVPAPGGNELSHDVDARRGLDDYVHLCFLDEHPMEYVARESGRIAQSKFLRVSTEVLKWDGVVFTAEVANRAGSVLLSLSDACATMDFEVIYHRTNWKDPEIQKRRHAAKKYEILVPRIIEPKYLTF